jgi:UDP-N-acetylglucosamine 2-epimerase
MIKVMTIVGTRPEIIKLSMVMKALNEYTEHTLVHTGQNYDYELNEIFFDELGIKKPDIFLNSIAGTPAQTIGDIIAKSDLAMKEVEPDAILLYGDTNSCLSVISAKRNKIPIFHMEAGNRCFDQRVPEEINRKIVDHLSDINLPLSEHARRYLIDEGLKPETVIKTGSAMKEVIEFHSKNINNSLVLDQEGLVKQEFFLMSIHREENVDSDQNFLELMNTIEDLSKKYPYPIIISTHPRTRKRLEALNIDLDSKRIRFMKPFGFYDYIKLQMNAFCVLSDSGTITEESSILSFPAIMIREAHERPEGMDEGALIMSGLKSNDVLNGVNVITQMFANSKKPHIIQDYNLENVSMKVVNIIHSYVGYVNRTIWKK